MSLPARIVTADRGDAGLRLDLVLRRHLTDVGAATRTRVQAWIANGQVTVNGAPVRRAAARAAFGDVVAVTLPDAAPRRVMAAEDVRLDLLYEDEHFLALDKPAGIVVHPGYRNPEGTVMNALLWHARGWPAVSDRPSSAASTSSPRASSSSPRPRPSMPRCSGRWRRAAARRTIWRWSTDA